MTKQEQFLWIAQTAILAYTLDNASRSLVGHADRTSSSVTAIVGTSNDAIYASSHIPSDMSALEAVHEFCLFTFWSPGDSSHKAEENRVPMPHWFTPPYVAGR